MGYEKLPVATNVWADHIIAEVSGIGTRYAIEDRTGDERGRSGFRVIVQTGPSLWMSVASGLSWTQAMDRVRDEVSRELLDNGGDPFPR